VAARVARAADFGETSTSAFIGGIQPAARREGNAVVRRAARALQSSARAATIAEASARWTSEEGT
jgi:hypothetical protein